MDKIELISIKSQDSIMTQEHIEETNLMQIEELSSDKIFSKNSSKKYIGLFAVWFILIIIELIGGIYSNSLCIYAFAGALLFNFIGICLATVLSGTAENGDSLYITYGYHRAEIIGSLLNVIFIWMLVIVLIYKGIFRICWDEINEVHNFTWIAVIGLLGIVIIKLLPKKAITFNLSTSFYLWQGVLVIITSVLIFLDTKLSSADPICAIIIGIMLLYFTIPITKECIEILMEKVPREIDINELYEGLKEITDVLDVHDLHVWSLTFGKFAMTCHLATFNPERALEEATKICTQKFAIMHLTIQIETPDDNLKCLNLAF